MPNSFANAAASAFATIRGVAGHEVTYQQGEITLEEITAVPGQQPAQFTEVESLGTNSRWRDYLIQASDLVHEETALEPTPGDRITDGGDIYEVQDIPGEPCWRWSDPHRQTFRIHTKYIGTE